MYISHLYQSILHVPPIPIHLLFYRRSITEVYVLINPLALEVFFLILAHPIYKM